MYFACSVRGPHFAAYVSVHPSEPTGRVTQEGANTGAFFFFLLYTLMPHPLLRCLPSFSSREIRVQLSLSFVDSGVEFCFLTPVFMGGEAESCEKINVFLQHSTGTLVKNTFFARSLWGEESFVLATTPKKEWEKH